jgi:upstream-binding transcription factor
MGANMVTTLVSLKWKDMSEEDKQVWNGKASEAMDAYKKEMEEYNKSIVLKLKQKTDEE